MFFLSSTDNHDIGDIRNEPNYKEMERSRSADEVGERISCLLREKPLYYGHSDTEIYWEDIVDKSAILPDKNNTIKI